MSASTQHALQLASWIQKNHPGLFRVIAAKAVSTQNRGIGMLPVGAKGEAYRKPARHRTMQGLGCACRRSTFGTFGQTGLTDIGLTSAYAAGGTGSTDISNLDLSGGTGTTLPGTTSALSTSPALQPIGTTAATSLPTTSIGSTGLTSASGSGDTSSSWLSGASSALSAVGSFLTSDSGLTAVAGLATAYFAASAANSNSKTAASNAATAEAVTQAQIARTASGAAPARVGYTPNADGSVTPVSVGTDGSTSPLTDISSILNGGNAGWLLIVGAVGVYFFLKANDYGKRS